MSDGIWMDRNMTNKADRASPPSVPPGEQRLLGEAGAQPLDYQSTPDKSDRSLRRQTAFVAGMCWFVASFMAVLLIAGITVFVAAKPIPGRPSLVPGIILGTVAAMV